MRSATAANSEMGCFVSVYQNLGKSEFQTKFKKRIARLGVRPSVSVAMRDNQSACFGGFLESSVVVGIAATAILNTVNVIVIVYHLVEKRCDHIFDGARERSCADVDFMTAANLGNPRIIVECEVTIGTRRALNGDGRS